MGKLSYTIMTDDAFTARHLIALADLVNGQGTAETESLEAIRFFLTTLAESNKFGKIEEFNDFVEFLRRRADQIEKEATEVLTQ